jgi:broad specificity phosphatase PhoE
MTMPLDLVLVRHGESEGNVAVEADKTGDTALFTDAYMTTPGHQWRLTEHGREQARTIGAWVAAEFPKFHRYYSSPYVRTKETAGWMQLPGARWLLNRALRERDWGEIGSIPKTEFQSRPEYELNAKHRKSDPLYWVAPGGESIAFVAEDRVRNVLDTLHRECSEQQVVCVTHGEVMWAFRLVLERMDDLRFAELDADPTAKIHNCMALHYSRVNPMDPDDVSRRLEWMRTARPLFDESTGTWSTEVSGWTHVEYSAFSSDDLLEQVDQVRPILDR